MLSWSSKLELKYAINLEVLETRKSHRQDLGKPSIIRVHKTIRKKIKIDLLV